MMYAGKRPKSENRESFQSNAMRDSGLDSDMLPYSPYDWELTSNFFKNIKRNHYQQLQTMMLIPPETQKKHSEDPFYKDPKKATECSQEQNLSQDSDDERSKERKSSNVRTSKRSSLIQSTNEKKKQTQAQIQYVLPKDVESP